MTCDVHANDDARHSCACADALACYERALTCGGDEEVAYNAACACARLGNSDRCAQLLQVCFNLHISIVHPNPKL